MRASRLTIAGVCIAVALAASVLPTSTDAAYYRIVNKQVQDDIREHWCRTPDNEGFLEIIRCDSRRSQLWEIWHGGGRETSAPAIA